MTDATDANPTTMPPLPPPELSEAYAGLPWQWKVGAVQLADRILAAAYRYDVSRVATDIVSELQAGAVKGMTLGEYVEEHTGAHARVTDWRRALQCLTYSTRAPLPSAMGGTAAEIWAHLAFRRDVQDELERRGYEVAGEWVDHGEEHTPGNR